MADTFVPTTSYAVVLGPDASPQDERAAALLTRLQKARETSYRQVLLVISRLLAAPGKYHGIYIHIGEGSYFKVGARFEVRVYQM